MFGEGFVNFNGSRIIVELPLQLFFLWAMSLSSLVARIKNVAKCSAPGLQFVIWSWQTMQAQP